MQLSLLPLLFCRGCCWCWLQDTGKPKHAVKQFAAGTLQDDLLVRLAKCLPLLALVVQWQLQSAAPAAIAAYGLCTCAHDWPVQAVVAGFS